jgi:hypothetical protein
MPFYEVVYTAIFLASASKLAEATCDNIGHNSRE